MKFRFVLSVVPGLALVLARCVSGDDSSNQDAGPDATQSDVANDVSKQDAAADAPVDVPIPPPTPDGSLVWLNHFNNNVGYYDTAFYDLAVNENGGLSYAVVGKFVTDPAAGNKYHFGTINLGPSTGFDFVSGGLSNTGSSVWATSAAAAGGGTEHYDAVAVDSQGNLYVFGSTTGTSVTLKDTLPGPTSFVAKLTATGTPVWDHAYSTSGNPVVGPIRLALAGTNVVVGVTFRSSITYDTSTTFTSDSGAGDSDVFMTALDTSTGTTKWTGVYGSPNDDYVSGIAPTPQGDVIVTGTLGGTMTGLQGPGMPLGTQEDASTTRDLYVMKIDSTGKSQYGLTYGSAGSYTNFSPSIAYVNGKIAVAGGFFGSIDFGKGTFVSSANDGFVMTIDEATKKTTFASQLTGAATDQFTTVALDPWGQTIAAGTYGNQNSSAQLGAQALPQTSLLVGAMVLAKWDANGTLVWAHGFVPTLDGGAPPYVTPDAANVPQSIIPTRVQTTSTGQIAVSGTMTGGTDFGKGYSGEVSTLIYNHCTCILSICITQCGQLGQPTCCSTPYGGGAADGIVGVWQP
jgi:hypothetical protein